jgi:transcriptional regulator with XRE-family HTH domain
LEDTAVDENEACLAERLREIRAQLGLSLQEVSLRSGISKSSLSKVENNQMSLTYAKLQKLSRGLGIDISELFGTRRAEQPPSVTARRSVSAASGGQHLATHQYDYYYLHSELTHRLMTPFRIVLRARSMVEFGEFIRHPSEEFIYVVEGYVQVCTEYYSPINLRPGDSLYIDSTMGHAYLSIGEKDAVAICICAGGEAGEQGELAPSFEGETQAVSLENS